jgi:nephrocystin-3
MEMYLGVFSKADPKAYFYIKRGVRREDELARLEEKIVRAGQPVRYFESSQELGALLRDDWRALIESTFTKTIDDPEQNTRQAFEQNRLRAYIAPEQQVTEVVSRVRSSQRVLIHAGSGSGKSSLMAYLSVNSSRLFPGVDTIPFYVGASHEASTALAAARSIIARLSDRADLRVDLPTHRDHVKDALARAFETVDGPTLLLLDAVNQFEGIDAELTWLPDALPPNVRVLVSSTVKLPEEARFAAVELPTLSSELKQTIIEQFFASYSKQLDMQEVQRIASVPQCDTPIFLRVLLEELRLFGSHEELKARIEHYLQARDVEALLSTVLTRLEQDFGSQAVSRLLSVLLVLRTGITESELFELSESMQWKVDRADLYLLVHAMEYHLARQQGALVFFHQYIRRAVLNRYGHHDVWMHQIQSELVQFFESKQIDRRGIIERMHLYDSLSRTHDLAELLLDPNALEIILKDDLRYEVLPLWRGLHSAGVSMAASYQGLLSREAGMNAQLMADAGRHLLESGASKEGVEFFAHLLRQDLEPTQRLRVTRELTAALLDAGDLSAAEASATDLIAQIANSADPLIRAEALAQVVQVYFERAKYKEAEPLARVIVEDLEKAFGESDARSLEARTLLADILTELGSYDEAEVSLRHILTCRTLKHGKDGVPTARAKNDLGTFLRRFTKRYEEAEPLLLSARDTFARSLGVDHADYSTIISNIGTLYHEWGRFDLAEKYHLEAVESTKALYGVKHPKTATACHNFAQYLRLRGKHEEALARFVDVLALRNEILGPLHAQTAVTNMMIGATLIDLGRAEEADSYFQSALEAHIQSGGERQPMVSYILNFQGNVRLELGRASEALEYYQRSLELKLELLGPQDPITAVTYHKMGQANLKAGKRAAAKESFLKAYEIRRSSLGENDPQTLASRKGMEEAIGPM